MKNPWVMFSGICAIVVVIVMFSVVAGGYSSFHRSQNRIKKTAELLVQYSQKRDQVIEKVIDYHKAGQAQDTAEKAATLLKEAAPFRDRLLQPERLNTESTILDFVAAQEKITLAVIPLIQQKISFDTQKKRNTYMALIRELYTAQDNLFLARKRYNAEVTYFNTRINAIPPALIARLFGFDEITYYLIMNDKLLASHKVFPEKP